MLKIRSLLFIFLSLFTLSAFASQTATEMLKQTTDSVIAQLQANKASIKNNKKLLNKIVVTTVIPKVDTVTMARSAMGRTNWNKMTPSQQKQFVNEFTTLLIRTYGAALGFYTDETVEYLPNRNQASGNRTQVQSVIKRNDGPPIHLNYRLVKRQNQWKIYDFSIDGISILRSFRAQFSNEISQLGIAGFLQKFAKYNKENS